MNPVDILTEDQARVMVHLREHGPQTTKDIQAAMGAAWGWKTSARVVLSLKIAGLVDSLGMRDDDGRACTLWWIIKDGAE